MDATYSMILSIFILMITLGFSVSARKSNIDLIRENKDNIRIFIYIYSLSFVLNLLVFYFLTHHGYISKEGKFEGESGKIVNEYFKLILDINQDIWLLIIAFIIAILPQIFTYILSGALFGVAGRIRLLEGATDFMIFGTVKAFSFIAGAVSSIILAQHLFVTEEIDISEWAAPRHIELIFLIYFVSPNDLF